jgi:hypothetical protein
MLPPQRMPQQPGIPFRPWAYLGLITVPLAIGAIITWYVSGGGAILFGDVDWYAAGLRNLVSDGPLYDPSKLVQHPLDRPAFFDQAPSTALLSLILLLPYGGWIWGFGIVLAVVTGLTIIWPRIGPGGAMLLVPVLLVWLPITSVLAWANVNGLIFCLLAIAWRYPRVAGVVIGLAAAIKLIPILAVAWLAGKRDWRGVAIAIAIPLIATAIVLAWKGPNTLVDFITLRLNQWNIEVPTRYGLTELLELPSLVAYAAGLIVAGLAYRYRSFSLAVVAMLVSVPALHVHYWTWLLIPFFGEWMPWLLRQRRTAPAWKPAEPAAVESAS